MIGGGINVCHGERVVGGIGGEGDGESMVAPGNICARHRVGVPGRDDAAARAIGRGESKGAEIGEQERFAFESIRGVEFGFLEADDVRVGDRDCITNRVALVLAIHESNRSTAIVNF